MGLQIGQIDEFQGCDVARGQDHGRGAAGLQRLGPAFDANAPTVSRLQPVEAELWARRCEIVSRGKRELQEFAGHPGAHRVEARVIGAGAAATIAKETGQRLKPAGLQLAAQDIRWHTGRIGGGDGEGNRQSDGSVSVPAAPEAKRFTPA